MKNLKFFKRMMAFCLTLALVLSMAVVTGITSMAAAENEGSITVQKPDTMDNLDGVAFDKYQIFEGTKNSNGSMYYTVADNFTAFFAQALTQYKALETKEGTGYLYYDDTNKTLALTKTDPKKGNLQIEIPLNAYLVNGNNEQYFAANLVNLIQNADDQYTFTKLLERYISDKPVTADAHIDGTAGDTSVTFGNLGYGYYLVTAQKGEYRFQSSLSVLKEDSNAVTVVLKGTTVVVDKTVKNEEDADYNDYADADIGDTLNYRIEASVPDTTGYTEYTYIIADTMTNLRLDQDSVKVSIWKDGEKVKDLTEDTNYTLTTAEHSLTVDFTDICNNTETYPVGGIIVVTYDATLDSTAVTTNGNEVEVTYGNGPDTASDKDIANVYSFGLDLAKTFEGYENELPADVDKVTFQLQKDGIALNFAAKESGMNGNYVHNQTGSPDLKLDENGKIVVFGLEAGTYTLVETATADGYQLLDPITFTISYTADEGLSVTVTDEEDNISVEHFTWGEGKYEGAQTSVVNMKYNFNLPTTGGVGTWIFTIGGLVLMAGAVLAFVFTRKKRHADR